MINPVTLLLSSVTYSHQSIRWSPCKNPARLEWVWWSLVCGNLVEYLTARNSDSWKRNFAVQKKKILATERSTQQKSVISRFCLQTATGWRGWHPRGVAVHKAQLKLVHLSSHPGFYHVHLIMPQPKIVATMKSRDEASRVPCRTARELTLIQQVHTKNRMKRQH